MAPRHTQQMSWGFEGTLLPEGDVGRVILGAGEPQALPGRYALVGLVDAHCHVTVARNADEPYLDGCGAPARLDALAQSGVTTLRDVGGDRQVTLDLARSSREGWPTVLAAGRFLAPQQRYFPRMYSPVEPDDLVAAVEQEIADGATWVKIIADFASGWLTSSPWNGGGELSRGRCGGGDSRGSSSWRSGRGTHHNQLGCDSDRGRGRLDRAR